MAEALRKGYSEIFSINEFAQVLDRKKFGDLVTQVTGSEKGNSADGLTVSTFFNLKEFADFEGHAESEVELDSTSHLLRAEADGKHTPPPKQMREESDSLGLNLSYTINLNLPETTDVNVYNAIFEAVRKNLLGRS